MCITKMDKVHQTHPSSHLIHTHKMHRTSSCTLLTVPNSINSTGTRILHYLLPWLPSASLLLLTLPCCSSTLHLQFLLLKAGPCCHAGGAILLLLSYCWSDRVYLVSFSHMQTKEHPFFSHFSKTIYFNNKHPRHWGDDRTARYHEIFTVINKWIKGLRRGIMKMTFDELFICQIQPVIY